MPQRKGREAEEEERRQADIHTIIYPPIHFVLFFFFFSALSLSPRLLLQVLIVHGGLFSQDGVTLDDIRAIDRLREPPDEGLMCDILWSDPFEGQGRAPSKRGVGVQFGEDVTEKFLKENGLGENRAEQSRTGHFSC